MNTKVAIDCFNNDLIGHTQRYCYQFRWLIMACLSIALFLGWSTFNRAHMKNLHTALQLERIANALNATSLNNYNRRKTGHVVGPSPTSVQITGLNNQICTMDTLSQFIDTEYWSPEQVNIGLTVHPLQGHCIDSHRDGGIAYCALQSKSGLMRPVPIYCSP